MLQPIKIPHGMSWVYRVATVLLFPFNDVVFLLKCFNCFRSGYDLMFTLKCFTIFTEIIYALMVQTCCKCFHCIHSDVHLCPECVVY